MSRDPEIVVGVGNPPPPPDARERMMRIILAAVPAAATEVRLPRSCCGHDPHPGKPCDKILAGMGGARCACKAP